MTSRSEQHALWRRAVLSAAGYRCVPQASPHCDGRGTHAHHILPTSKGGDDVFDNGLSVCWPCHQWIHTGHPDLARARGWLRQRGDTQ